MIKNICGYIFYKHKQRSEEMKFNESPLDYEYETSKELGEKKPEEFTEFLMEECSKELGEDIEVRSTESELITEEGAFFNINSEDESYDSENLINSYLKQQEGD